MIENKIIMTHLKSRLFALTDLEKELQNEDYKTVSQIMVHIHNSIEFQKEFNKEKNV